MSPFPGPEWPAASVGLPEGLSSAPGPEVVHSDSDLDSGCCSGCCSDSGLYSYRYFGPDPCFDPCFDLGSDSGSGSLLVLIFVITTVCCGLMTYKRCRNRKAKIMVLGATLAFFSYFIHGILNNFLDTDKLAVPVWSCAALIVAVDVYFADKEEIEKNE